jgi:hypothetical protein
MPDESYAFCNVMFAPQIKEFVKGSARFESDIEYDLGPPKILLHDEINFGVNVSHLMWSASDSAIRLARLSASNETLETSDDHSFESQKVELMFRSDFPLLVGVEIPLSTPKVVIPGAISSRAVQPIREGALPLFDKSFWSDYGTQCGAHDIPAFLEIYDDAFLLIFSNVGELCWYNEMNAVLLGEGNAFIGIAHRFSSANFRAQLLAPSL